MDSVTGKPDEVSEAVVVVSEAFLNSGTKIPTIFGVAAAPADFTTEESDLVDGAPKPVKEGVSKDEANAIKAQLEEAGAEVEVK